MTEVLRVDDLSKSYGETTALAGVSLSVDAGEVFGLIGPNGAGKTTLIRALTGTTRVEGTVEVFDEPPTDVDPDRIGLLPQSFGPPARLTARELIHYYAGLYDDPRDPERVLADVGLADAADTWYENLSGGQKRRVCVGTALVNDPELLFLDEPTTGIDPSGRRAIWRLVSALAESGTTVLLTSHDMAEVQHLADRIGLLAAGELLATGTAETLIDAYGGRPRLVVRTDADPAALGDVEGVDGVVSPDPGPHPDGLAFEDVDPADIGAIAQGLDEQGIEYDSLTWAEPTLEDVYLHLAGDTRAGGSPHDQTGDRPGESVGRSTPTSTSTASSAPADQTTATEERR
ncbi:MAG: ABC transporter ATP-binding protein [Haloferacaceae archaeon]